MTTRTTLTSHYKRPVSTSVQLTQPPSMTPRSTDPASQYDSTSNWPSLPVWLHVQLTQPPSMTPRPTDPASHYDSTFNWPSLPLWLHVQLTQPPSMTPRSTDPASQYDSTFNDDLTGSHPRHDLYQLEALPPRSFYSVKALKECITTNVRSCADLLTVFCALIISEVAGIRNNGNVCCYTSRSRRRTGSITQSHYHSIDNTLTVIRNKIHWSFIIVCLRCYLQTTRFSNNITLMTIFHVY